MPIWLVRTIWSEDETEATELWEINADTAADAVTGVTPHIRFPPHHVEARLSTETDNTALKPGEVRRVPPK